MRHTLKESILQGPVHFYVGLGRSYFCHLRALLSVLKAMATNLVIRRAQEIYGQSGA
jgi:hypothetical protein